MRHARAHYVHVVCTSGHPLWRCSKQPIIYSTLISTHVNPHQSSHSQGYHCGSHTASWQDMWRKYKKQLLGLIWTCRHTTAGPPSPDCNQLSPSKPITELEKKKVIRQIADWPRCFDSLQALGVHLKRHASLIAYSAIVVASKSQA